MRRPPAVLAPLVAALALSGAAAGPAAAQDAPAPDGAGIGLVVREASAHVDLTFRSDRRTCRAVGRCGLRGDVRFRATGPAVGGGFVGVAAGTAIGGGGFYAASAATTARVRDRGQLCRDRIAHRVTTFGVRQRGDALQVVFLAPAAAADVDADGSEDPLSTRCAGPRLPDLQASGALPVATTTLAALQAGPVTLRAQGRERVRGAGMRGTVRFDLAVAVAPAAPPSA